MRKFLLSFSLAIFSSSLAFAADFSEKTKPSAPVAQRAPAQTRVFSWSGPYAGIAAGYAQHRYNVRSDYFGDGHLNEGGFLAGATLGTNWQAPSNIVLGIETDMSYNFARKSFLDTAPYNGGQQTLTASFAPHFLGTTRLRLGYAVDRLLVFATAGLAYGNPSFKYNRHSNYMGSCEQHNGSTTCTHIDDLDGHDSSWKVGFALGGGLEYAFNPAWSMKLEGLYYNLGNTNTMATYNAEQVYQNEQPPYVAKQTFDDTARDRVRHDGFLVRSGLNYHF